MREFFHQNETIILFGYGLVFFVLGFAVWLQRRRASRMLLTNALIWLAVFALIQALAIWGQAFVPIQESYLDGDIVSGLVALRGALQSFGFLFLIQFGLRLLHVGPRVRWGLTAASAAAWLGIVGASALAADRSGWGVDAWENSTMALARLVLLVPGALLSAVGMWRQREELAASGMLTIRPYVATTAAVLVAYAVLGGLVIDPAPWVGAVPNERGWFGHTGVPLALVRGAVGLALCMLCVKLLEIFDVEAKQRLDALERSRAVSDERARFRRDLHDGTIQSIYAAALRLEATAQSAPDDRLREDLRGVVSDLNTTIDDIRRYITDLSETPDTPSGVAMRVRALTAELARESRIPIRVKISGEGVSGPVPDGTGRHLEQIAREAVSNAARHAGPCAVDVVLTFAPDEMELIVRDDGAGIDEGETTDHEGQGMRNMRERARRLGGRLSVHSAASGTRIVVSLPLDTDVPADQPLRTQPLPEVISE
ncbi:MAG: hypothetical protein KDC33_02175 [Thermoleophilia bacterium]|nr:hypothetical protein [Thermoleophilia bacterium]